MGEDDVRRIVEEHYADVLAYCRRHTPNADAAQDAAQDVFLRFVRNVPRYRDRGKPLAFLLTIARTVCIDASRTRTRAASHTAGTDELLAALPDEHAARAHAPSDLEVALERLDAAQREVLELRFDQELHVQDVARVLGVSRFAAARRITAALDALRSELEAVRARR